MNVTEALQQLDVLQKKMYAYNAAASSLYLDSVTTAPSDTAEEDVVLEDSEESA